MRVNSWWLSSTFFAVLALPINGGVLKVADTFKFWNESGITKDMVREQISNVKCFSDELRLSACRNALADAIKELDDANAQWVADDFDSVLDHIDQVPLSHGLSKQWLFGLMLNSFLRTYDGHAQFAPTAAYDTAFGPDANGVGVKLMATDNGVYIRSVVANSPAAHAGLKPFDILDSVNGDKVGKGLQGQVDSLELKGRPGDSLKVGVIRKGVSQVLEVTVGVVADLNIETENLAFNGRRYSVIRFNQFEEDSCEDLKVAIGKLPAKTAGLILDLRDNPGGVLDEGICIAGLFVGKKDIVGEKAVDVRIPFDVSYHPVVDGIIKWMPSYRTASFADLPLVILVNQNSASAAEFTAGALQDYKAAWVVGEKSFGKGSVQNIEKLPSDDRFYVGYTMALFYRPSGSTNQRQGVTPNFEIPMRRTFTAADRHVPRELDLYPNSLTPMDQPALWHETRPEAEALKLCVQNTAGDLTANEMIIKKTGSEDYQEAYALGLFDCTVGATAQHNASKNRKVAEKK
jgi:carboxyl-terminal processing protease